MTPKLQAEEVEVPEDAEAVEQPEDDRGDHDEIEDAFDRRLHGDVGVHQPKHDADHDQDKDHI